MIGTTTHETTEVRKAADTAKALKLADIARESLAATLGDVADAVEVMLERIEDDPDLRRAIAAEAIELASREAVGMAMRAERASIWKAPPAPKTTAAHLASGILGGLLDFPLMGGLRLRHATRDDVMRTAEGYETRRDDAAAKARWLRAIAARVPEGRVVGNVLTEEAVRSLRDD